MSLPDDETRLRDMRGAADKAVQAVQGRVRVDLEIDFVLAAALERLVEIIGEAASHVTTGTQRTIPDLPWREIIGMRNRLVHGYAAVDRDVLWDVVHDDLPGLIAQLDRAIG